MTLPFLLLLSTLGHAAPCGSGDQDDDGVPDVLEDLNGDGDCDNDDTDSDGVPDWRDKDDDDDTLSTREEVELDGDPDIDDFDRDGIPDHLDPDDDNDGIPSSCELWWETLVYMTQVAHVSLDSDEDGIPDAIEYPVFSRCRADMIDTDEDGPPNWLDKDDDGDGLTTLREGTRDEDMAPGTAPCDASACVTCSPAPDGIPNYLDYDSDGDELGDLEESDWGAQPELDPDGDGVPEWRDCEDGDWHHDCDMDGISTELEKDRGEDPACNDSDGDGLLDNFEHDFKDGWYQSRDSDGNGTTDVLDDDDDGDGIPTADENADPNGDGDPADARDFDGDDIPDYLDTDPTSAPPPASGRRAGRDAPGGCSTVPPSGLGLLGLLGLPLLGARRRRLWPVAWAMALFTGACTPEAPTEDTGSPQDTDTGDTDTGDTDTGGTDTGGTDTFACDLPEAGDHVVLDTADDVDAFCTSYSGVVEDASLTVNPGAWSDPDSLACLCTVGSLIVPELPTAEAHFPHLSRARSISINAWRTRVERVTFPVLEQVDGLTLNGHAPMVLELPSATSIGRFQLGVPLRGLPLLPDGARIDTLTTAFSANAFLNGKVLPGEGDPSRTLHAGVVDIRVPDPAAFDDLPCLDIDRSVAFRGVTGEPTWTHCSDSLEALEIEGSNLSSFTVEPGVDVSDVLSIRADRALERVPGVRPKATLRELTHIGAEWSLDTTVPSPELERVTMHGASDHSALDAIERIEIALDVRGNQVGSPLTGLNGLTFVQAAYVGGAWPRIDGLRKLEEARFLSLSSLIRVESLSLPALREVGRLTLTVDPKLTDLSGLHGLEVMDELCLGHELGLSEDEISAFVSAIDTVGDTAECE